MLKLCDFGVRPTGRIWWTLGLSLIYIVTLSKKRVQPNFGEIPPLSIAARGPQSLTFSRKWPHFKRFHVPQFLKESCQILNFEYFLVVLREPRSRIFEFASWRPYRMPTIWPYFRGEFFYISQHPKLYRVNYGQIQKSGSVALFGLLASRKLPNISLMTLKLKFELSLVIS